MVLEKDEEDNWEGPCEQQVLKRDKKKKRERSLIRLVKYSVRIALQNMLLNEIYM
jgi:hypothetical protein